mgnify:FL=1
MVVNGYYYKRKFDVVRVIAIKISIVGRSTFIGIGTFSLGYVLEPDEKDNAAGAGVCETSM